MTLRFRAHDFRDGPQRRFPALGCHDLSEWLLRTASLGEFVGMTVSMQRLPCKRLQPFSSSFTALAGE